jgi:hypothetical protein
MSCAHDVILTICVAVGIPHHVDVARRGKNSKREHDDDDEADDTLATLHRVRRRLAVAAFLVLQRHAESDGAAVLRRLKQPIAVARRGHCK